MKYAVISKLSVEYPVLRLCQTLKVHPSGYYAWLAKPKSVRVKEDQRLLGSSMPGWKAVGSTATARSTMTCESWGSPVAGIAWLA